MIHLTDDRHRPARDGEPECGACDDCLATGVGLRCTRAKHDDRHHVAHDESGAIVEEWDEPPTFCACPTITKLLDIYPRQCGHCGKQLPPGHPQRADDAPREELVPPRPPWCQSCQSYHATDEATRRAVKCFAATGEE